MRSRQVVPAVSNVLQIGADGDGGYLVPTNAEREILRRMTAISPIRAIHGLPRLL